MQCLERFNKRMNFNGGSLRNEILKNNRRLLNETFADDTSFQLGVYFWSLGKKSYEQDEPLKIRFYERAFSNANGGTVKFQTPHDTPVIVGDVIWDSDMEEFYICTESFNINNIHWQGKFTVCNWILKWQNKNGDILEYPCIDINATQYNSGEQSNTRFTVGSTQHMLTLPYDENTVKLKTPQRFILDKDTESPSVFIVTQNDNTSYGYGKKGLVRVTLYEDVFNPKTDRPDLGICDYFELDSQNDGCPLEIKKIIAKIEYKTNIIKSGGNKRTFFGKFFDENGNEITNMSHSWDVVCDFIDILDYEINGNQFVVGIDNDDYIDEEFKLVFSDVDNKYSDSVLVSIGSLL